MVAVSNEDVGSSVVNNIDEVSGETSHYRRHRRRQDVVVDKDYVNVIVDTTGDVVDTSTVVIVFHSRQSVKLRQCQRYTLKLLLNHPYKETKPILPGMIIWVLVVGHMGSNSYSSTSH